MLDDTWCNITLYITAAVQKLPFGAIKNIKKIRLVAWEKGTYGILNFVCVHAHVCVSITELSRVLKPRPRRSTDRCSIGYLKFIDTVG